MPSAPEPNRDGWRDAVADPPDTNREVEPRYVNGHVGLPVFWHRESGKWFWLGNLSGKHYETSPNPVAWREIP